MTSTEQSGEVPTIVSKEDLANFIEALRDDFLHNSAGWENPTIDKYLDAMAAWVRSMDNYYRHVGEGPPIQPTWRTIGHILSAAKVYE